MKEDRQDRAVTEQNYYKHFDGSYEGGGSSYSKRKHDDKRRDEFWQSEKRRSPAPEDRPTSNGNAGGNKHAKRKGYGRK